MSINSWIKEVLGFKSMEDLNDYLDTCQKLSEKELLEFCIKKWKGVREKTLKKHKLEVSGCSLFEDYNPYNNFYMNGDYCPLCIIDDILGNSDSKCNYCLIKKYTKRKIGEKELCHKEYKRWSDWGDPEPMIKLLEDILKKAIIFSRKIKL